MPKNKNLLVVELLQSGINCISVGRKSTAYSIIIETITHYSFNQVEFVSNYLCQIPFVIKTIKRDHGSPPLIAWVIDEPFIESFLIDPSKKLPVHDIRKAAQLYHDKKSAILHCNTIAQALLLQLRLISYALDSYCLSPVSRFFLLFSIYKNQIFSEENELAGDVSVEQLETFFSCSNVQKIMPLQKNIAQENYRSYILVYGLLNHADNLVKKDGKSESAFF